MRWSRRTPAWIRACLAPLLLGGCVAQPWGDGTSGGALASARLPWPAGDPITFASEVQPVLARRCANPSCHGSGRTFEVFALGLHRMPPRLAFSTEPMDAAELRHNQRQVEARIVTDAVNAAPLLGMTLGGSGGHRFGAVFADRYEPDYLALRAWIAATLATTTADASSEAP